MKKILIVVDMQNDFIDGALGTKEAVAIVPKVEEKIRNFDGEVFFTRDTHETYYLETQEGKNLPVKHCIRDTEGWQIRKEIADLISTEPIIKETFGSSRFQLENHIQHLFRVVHDLICRERNLAYRRVDDTELIGDEVFRLIINAMLIARYGLTAMELTKEGDPNDS